MNLTKFVASLAGGLAITGAASAQANNDALSQIAELKAEIATLKTQNTDKWLTSERAEEIKGLVRDVLADADTRASLQGSGATAGYDNGFFVSSADGNFKLRINGLEQVRFVYNQNNGPNPSVAEWGFENRRTQLTFSGNVVDPSWTYAVRFNYGADVDPYDATVNAFVLQDASISKSLDNGWGFTAGQFKTPYMRESGLNDGVQLAAERSVVDYRFSSGYQQGVMLNYSADQFRMSASYGNGFREVNGTDAQFQNQAWNAGGTSFAVAARAEFKLSGDWAQFSKETSFRGESSGFMLGAAIGYENDRGAGSNPAGIDPYNSVKWTVDATAMFGGSSLSAAFVGQNAQHDATTSAANPGAAVQAKDYGMVVQGGHMLSDEFEVFGRWEYYNLQNTANSGAGTLMENIVTVGANYYFARNNAKFTVDVGIPMNKNSNTGYGNSFTGDQGAGWVNSTGEQWNIRAQLQVAF